MNAKTEETRNVDDVGKFSESKSSKKARKAEEANQKRLESLKNVRNLAKSREKAVSETLKRIDSGAKPKVIKFTSDDEEKSAAAPPKSIFNGTSSNANKLFSSDSEGSADEDGDEIRPNKTKMDVNLDEFAILPQYEGKAGQKLLALQSKFAGDQRFKMNSKFLDDFKEPSADGINETIPENSSDKESSNEIEQEHNQQMNILEKILGKSLEKSNKNVACKDAESNFDNVNEFSNVKKGTPRPMVRFDPNNPTHYRYKIVQNENSSNEISPSKFDKKNLRLVEELLENLTKEEDSRKKEELIENCGRSLYEVDATFLQRLKEISTNGDSEKTEGPKKFSLLTALGRHKSEETAKNDYELNQPGKQNQTKTQLKDWQIDLIDPKLRRDSSGSDEDEEIGAKKPATKREDKKSKAKITKPSRQLFFFYLDESLIKDGDKFYSPENPEVVKKKWEKLRPFLVDTYKKRRKQLVRNLKKAESAKSKTGKKYTNNRKFHQNNNFSTNKSPKFGNKRGRTQSQKPKKRLKLDFTNG